MKKLQLFQYAILWHPTEKQATDDGAKSKVITQITSILSNDDKSAAMAAAMQIPSEYKDNLEQIEIVVRPF
jgi:predicted RNase H-like nuclease (RuvC/YqgF family)